MTQRYILTLIANPEKVKLATPLVKGATDLCRAAGFTVSEPEWLAPEIACDIYLSAPKDPPNALFASMLAEALRLADAVIQPESTTRKKKLLLSDMDSTIIQQECIDELADIAGLRDQVSVITERAMQGELDFKQALTERVMLLKGLSTKALEKVYDERIQLMPGAKALVATMKANGARCVLVSGGFTYFTSRVRDAVGFDSDRANLLDVADNMLTGEVVPPILDKDAKLQSLKENMFQLDLPKELTLAIGDGANDLPMIEAAGLGVAYHAKPVVRAKANASLNHADLTGVLYMQGYKKSEIIS